MKYQYDPQADALYIEVSQRKIIESDMVDDGVILDYDQKGQIVGIEILDASKIFNQSLHHPLTIRRPVAA